MLAQAQDIDVIDVTDTGPRKAGLERLCVATRRVQPVGEMIRFVAGPEGLVPDLKRKLPGRGVWVTGRRQAVADAVKSGAFKRSLKADVKVPADLPGLTERLLVKTALDALAIAYKARQVVPGFAKIEAAIAGDNVAALIHAAGAGGDGVRKLAAAVTRRHGEEAGKVTVVRGFTPDELDLALGRPNVIHAALLAGRASETFLARWRDLERFRTTESDQRGRGVNDVGEPETAAPELGSE